MTLISGIAIYFIVWWMTLFTMLPLGLRTQGEEKDVTLGTVSSAPLKPRIGRAFLRTTLVATIIFALYYYITQMSGLTFDDIPHFIPDMK
ncbi:MAG: DUF1467 family protein [Rhizobiales bacterium]|nr:DUF1467 family protein [Hyphomicrobiales bacterium]OJX99353.1 MAG: hypothetical protein BGP07_04785 [Rhizobiales bacterium 63-22]